ncbi:MAG: hypothetical protein HY547_02700 [Elusimicrobia bacterium]|nr:hypothetical protein [Elusimicrobiota bacterium]
MTFWRAWPRLIRRGRFWRRRFNVLNFIVLLVLAYGAASISATVYFAKEINRITPSAIR